MIDFDFASLRTIGFTQTIAGQLHTLTDLPANAALVRITEVHRDRVHVHDGQTQSSARPLLTDALATGDWAVLHEGRIIARIEPVNHLARRTAEGRSQAIASNIDTALLVMGLDHDFNPRRLERYLALVQAAAVAPVIVLTKSDIGSDVAHKLDELHARLPRGTPILAVNGLDAGSTAALAPWLGAGQTLILLGSSGAGKSTLTNTLTGAAQATGGVREDDSRGRHTTTARSLHQCAHGACIIDTPGLRSLQPDLNEDALAASFEDIESLAAQCQFRDCSHDEEPGCAVRGAVHPDRLRNYHKLLRESRRAVQTPLDRIAARNKWKVLMRAAGARSKDKRG
ncbi:ribosome small subunit-dependent GTPase A [Massilia sp. CF038]|uniref:ribosome small subunit-dependent GTPase A n=1 Tax=Massilia sp. CF038 TaxID=1881045 RepID=UPI000913E3E8|nr:ribosome small subunit-dependent GTPase A [Massilia sp. CF038]SHG57038.1 ribosome biogenesis GTPase [Massilia sp. CF038]